MNDAQITIYHNPACGTSRNTLALIRNSGVEPTVIHYLETPPSRATLLALIAAMGMPVRDLLRQNVPPMRRWDWPRTSSATMNWSMPCWLILF